MRATLVAITAVSIFVALGLPLWASSPGAVYVNYVEGSVEHVTVGSHRGVPARANKALAEGETLVAHGKGNAELFIRDGSAVRITEGSRLKVLSIERGAVQLFLASGKAHVNFKGLKGYPLFLNTPSAKIDVFDRAAFRLDVNDAGETEISVLAGELYVAQEKGRMKIIVGTRLIMRKDGKAPVYTTNRPADDWDKWNKKRDGEIQLPSGDRGESRRPAIDSAPPGPDPNAPRAAVPEQAALAPVVTHEYIYVGMGPSWSYSWYPYPWRPCPWGWWGPRYPRWWGPWRWHGGHWRHPPRRYWR